MTIEQAIEKLKDMYQWALTQPHIHNPLAYALYQVWRKADK